MNEYKGQAWRCTVCGYIHRDKKPPGECTVCGAPKKLFESFNEKIKSDAPAAQPNNWRCLVCTYEQIGDTPLDKCPVCGAPGKSFEPIDKQNEIKSGKGKKEKIIIAGGGIAGIAAAESIRQYSDYSEILLISKEKHLPYYRLNLTRWLADKIDADALPIHSESWYEKNRIKLVMGDELSEISLDQKKITLLAEDAVFPFDKLILATGSHPFVPPVTGANMEGVTTLRTLDDARYIRSNAKNAAVIVIGGGVLGLEAAVAMVKYAKQITVLENFDYLMPRQLSKKAALMLENNIAGKGIKLRVNVSIKELTGDKRVKGVMLEDGETLPADLVVFSTGIRANSYLARAAGIQVNRGILVNDYLQTSHPDVYAVGDLAEHRGISYGLWGAAQFQGSIAGMNAAGLKAEFGGIPRSNTLKVLGVDLFSIGNFEPDDGSYIVIEKKEANRYERFVFHDTHLVGAILYGDTSRSADVKRAIETSRDFSEILQTRTDINKTWKTISAIE